MVKVSGNLLKDGGIVVGDYLELAVEGGEFKVLRVRPRRNEIYRMLVREKKKKVSASNVDYTGHRQFRLQAGLQAGAYRPLSGAGRAVGD